MPSISHKELVITVHGIRDFGQWQSTLEYEVKKVNPETEVEAYDYGYFPIPSFLTPIARQFIVSRFKKYLIEKVSSGSYSKVSIVAHSFGTHVVSWALRGLSSEDTFTIDNLILCGSVLKQGFKWSVLTAGNNPRVKRVINECGERDWVLGISQVVVLGTGMAGRVGFRHPKSEIFRDRFFDFEHGDYFIKTADGIPDFIVDKWIPLLTSDRSITQYPKPEYTMIQKIKHVLLGFFGTIKPLVYGLTAFFIFHEVYVLNEGVKEGRSTRLVALSENIYDTRPKSMSTAAVVAVLAHRQYPTHETRQFLNKINTHTASLDHVFEIPTTVPPKLNMNPDKTLLTFYTQPRNGMELKKLKTQEVHVYDLLKKEHVFSKTWDKYKIENDPTSDIRLIRDTSIASDGKLITIAFSVGKGREVRQFLEIYDIATGKMLHDLTLPNRSRIFNVQFSPNSQKIAVSQHYGITIINLDQNLTQTSLMKVIPSIKHKFLLTPDHIVASVGGKVVLFKDWHSGSPVKEKVAQISKDITGLQIASDARMISGVTGSKESLEKEMMFISTKKEYWKTTSYQMAEYLKWIKIPAKGGSLYYLDIGGHISRINPYEIDNWAWFSPGNESVRSFDVDETGQKVAFSTSNYVTVVDTKRPTSTLAFMTHKEEEIFYIRFLKDNKFLTVGADKTVRIWKLPQNTTIGDEAHIKNRLSSRNKSPTVNLPMKNPRHVFFKNNAGLHCLARFQTVDMGENRGKSYMQGIELRCSPDWQTINEEQFSNLLIGVDATFGVRKNDGAILVFTKGRLEEIKNWGTGKPERVLVRNFPEKLQSDFLPKAFSTDGKKLVYFDSNKSIKIFDTQNGIIRDFVGLANKERVKRLEFSPTNQHIFARMSDDILRVYAVKDGKLVLQFDANSENPESFSPDAQWFAVSHSESKSGEGSEKEDIKSFISVFDLMSGKLKRKISLRGYEVHDISFVDESRIAVMGKKTVIIYDWRTESETTRYNSITLIRAHKVSPDGKFLYIEAIRDQSKILQLSSEDVQEELCTKLFGIQDNIVDAKIDNILMPNFRINSRTTIVSPSCVCDETVKIDKCISK